MKKVGIFNHWSVNNYGALFLAYALERKLLELGYDAETIDYLPDEVAKPWKLSMVKKIGILQYTLRLGYFLVFILPRSKSFSTFRSKMHISQRKYTDATFPEIQYEYDKVIAGGDQLWNCKPIYFNENNFLPFIKEKRRKAVYAASLAQDKMREGFEEEFRQLASGFGYITTREERATEIIEQLTHLKAPRVADPAFLLTAEEWAALSKYDEQKNKKEYIFVYQVQSDIEIINYAQKLAREKNLDIIYCPFPLKKQISCKRKPYISPEEWLGYMKNAKYVITDAFHGLVFALIFNKQFMVEISNYGKDTHSRITNLLTRLHLEKRLFSNDTAIKQIDETIDYDAVNIFIREDCQQSIKHIRNIMAM